jgi:hypothetical protein
MQSPIDVAALGNLKATAKYSLASAREGSACAGIDMNTDHTAGVGKRSSA